MTAITSAAAGDWNTGGTWTGGVKPQNGDTVTISHAVTVSTSEIVGTSPASNTTPIALTVASAGSLTIQSTGFLKVRGPATIQNTALTINGDGILEMDASQATSPSTRTYRMRIGSANNQASSYLVLNGSSGHRAIFRSNSGGGNGFCDGGATFTRAGKVKCKWGSFLRIGDATNDCAQFDLGTSGDATYWEDTVFDGCGGYSTQNNAISDGTDYHMDRCRWKNTAAGNPVHIQCANDFTTGTRRVSYTSFDHQPQFYGPWGLQCQHNCFGVLAPDLTVASYRSFEYNFAIQDSSGGFSFQITGPLGPGRNYLAKIGASSNEHWTKIDGDCPACDIDGLIFELAGSNGTNDTGDCISVPTNTGSGTPVTWRAKNIMVLADSDGHASGTLATVFSTTSTNPHISFEHCTHRASARTTPGVSVEEQNGGSPGTAGIVEYYKNNLAWGASGDNGLKINNVCDAGAALGTTDLVSAANCHNNGGFNLQAGLKGLGYNTPMTGTPGTGDISGDPLFVDSARNLAKWDLSNGGPGTAANALAEMLKMGDDGWNPAYEPSLLINYVVAGFVVQNTSMRTGADDGSVMGAVQGAPPASALDDDSYLPEPFTFTGSVVSVFQ
jgi:hypothetical protein